MATYKNQHGQPIGFPVTDWQQPPVPPREVMRGTFCRLEPLSKNQHARPLFEANALDRVGRNWTYLSAGPFARFEDYATWVEGASRSSDRLYFAIIDAKTDGAVGVASYLRITPVAGTIEVGDINYSPRLQRQPAATEAMYLMMRQVFALGYRRYEWKCDALNAPSRAAAQRLGFSYEGLFRQALVYKGRNRDTAWYAILDTEWPSLRAAFERWLSPENFDGEGTQKMALSALTGPLLNARG